MAELSKSGTPSTSSILPPQNQMMGGLLAGEAIAAGDACYIKNDGKVWRSIGAAANAAADVFGFAAGPASVMGPVTLCHDVNFSYGSGLTPGTKYYLSGSVAGGLADAASTGGVKPTAYAIDATRLRVLRTLN